MKNVAFIPLDNRPVSYNLIHDTVSLNDEINLILPPKEFLGSLYKPAQSLRILAWLKEQIFDYLVVSLDTIAYNGLIQSRQSVEEFKNIKNNIDELFKITLSKNARVYAFSSVMRISDTNINEEEKHYWDRFGHKIFEYSYNVHKFEITNDEDAKLNYLKYKKQIPPQYLDDYLQTRQRNFDLNKYYIELQKKDLIDVLIFSKDDCAKYGLNVKEAYELNQITQNNLDIFIKTGADEIPLILLTKLFMKDKKIKINVQYTQNKFINKISKYEDISLKESVENQIEIAGGTLSDKKSADIVLLVNNFKNEQGEIVMGVYEPEFNSKINLPKKKKFFIADILNANGADNRFIKNLFPLIKNNENFYGYSAWNTTSNTLGSAIAIAFFKYFSKTSKDFNFKKTQFIRFLDDWAYQANVRQLLKAKTHTIDLEMTKLLMKKYQGTICDLLNFPSQNVEYSFPWNRYFEIEIKI